ncbi:hypothetical protein AGMMS50222_07620 [Endomicrobiia bacterium]|nr:hypothetical protein AGMMS49531_03650 [Endomicrobiia bacterium]GHT71221.1 hypothetical protein AGMMS49950_07500 [Endomicrobiia bacterium]GHT75851.1 hypothetical protein AGMMS50222_07620 [Endomicrobiia bacterium]
MGAFGGAVAGVVMRVDIRGEVNNFADDDVFYKKNGACDSVSGGGKGGVGRAGMSGRSVMKLSRSVRSKVMAGVGVGVKLLSLLPVVFL